MKATIVTILLVLIAVGAGWFYFASYNQPTSIVLTGVVTTDSVIVSPQIQGQVQQLLVNQGDKVNAQQLLAVIEPREAQADLDYYASTAQQYADLTKQAQSDLEMARLTWERDEKAFAQHVVSAQDYDQGRLAYEGAKMRVESLQGQTKAAEAQRDKATVQLGYTKVTAPISGVVDTRVALQGEVVNVGQPIVTLIDPDDLWVRADVEETYIDQVHLGQTLRVKFPSGQTRDGTVFYRGIDADYATQRDVSRTKRDIKTFEIRLRCDNHDRALAVGMTAYVDFPLNK